MHWKLITWSVLTIAYLCMNCNGSHKELGETTQRPSSRNRQGKAREFPSQIKKTSPVLEKMVDLGEGIRERPPSTTSGHNRDASGETGVQEDKQEKNSSSLTIARSLSNMTKDSGETVRLRCEFKGRPLPQIQWYKNEAPLEPEKNKVEIKKYSQDHGVLGSRVRIFHTDIHDTGYYKCEATNGKDTLETTGILIVRAGRSHSPSMIPNFPPPFPHFPGLEGKFPDFEQDDLGFCQVYHGVTCSQFIGNKTVYVKAALTVSKLEEKLAAVFPVLASNKEMSTECHKYAVSFFCFVVFPLCDESIPYPTPVQVCRDDCETLESATCLGEISVARRHPLLKQQDLLPKCTDLPAHQEGSKDGKRCINLNIPRVVQVDHDQTCYEGRGENYRGPVSHTMSSQQCQKWSLPVEYQELSGNHNYCRNPGGQETQPWCFISNPARREICDIPKCDEYAWLYILLPSVIAAVLLGLLLGLWCKRQRKKSCAAKLSPQGTTAQLIPTHHNNHSHNQHSHHHHLHHQQIEMQKFLPRVPMCVLEAPVSSIRFLHELGEGIFGKVYRGELHHAGGSISPVAIKTLREGASTLSQTEFSREIESMSTLQHSNVVCLIAVCVRNEPFCMLFEYMFQCDLHEYLLVHSPHSDVSARSDDGTPHILELTDFLVISKQIASGMDYLSSKRYVHRDLAARNCLVSAETSTPVSQTCGTSNSTSSTMNNIVVKISDLGVSRNSCASDYFRIRNTLLPVRWMAPESLLYGTFTTESDVWSFGVLLWEIFSYAIQPYFNYDSQEVIDLVCTHQLLSRPEYCPSYVYAIMNDCWHDTASHRPGFKEIYNRLCSMQTLHERAFSISHSVLTHNSSQPSSTGPSNKTLSTNLSGGTSANHSTPMLHTGLTHSNGTPPFGANLRQQQPQFPQPGYPFCNPSSLFITSKMISNHRTHQCEQV